MVVEDGDFELDEDIFVHELTLSDLMRLANFTSQQSWTVAQKSA